MGDKYEVKYFCGGNYYSVGFYHYFWKAKRVAKKYAKDYYCVSILIRTKED